MKTVELTEEELMILIKRLCSDNKFDHTDRTKYLFSNLSEDGKKEFNRWYEAKVLSII